MFQQRLSSRVVPASSRVQCDGALPMRGSRPSGHDCIRSAIRSLEVETVAKPSDAQTPIAKVSLLSVSNSLQQPSRGFTGLFLCSFLWGERMGGLLTGALPVCHASMRVGGVRVQTLRRVMSSNRHVRSSPEADLRRGTSARPGHTHCSSRADRRCLPARSRCRLQALAAAKAQPGGTLLVSTADIVHAIINAAA